MQYTFVHFIILGISEFTSPITAGTTHTPFETRANSANGNRIPDMIHTIISFLWFIPFSLADFSNIFWHSRALIFSNFPLQDVREVLSLPLAKGKLKLLANLAKAIASKRTTTTSSFLDRSESKRNETKRSCSSCVLRPGIPFACVGASLEWLLIPTVITSWPPHMAAKENLFKLQNAKCTSPNQRWQLLVKGTAATRRKKCNFLVAKHFWPLHRGSTPKPIRYHGEKIWIIKFYFKK